MSRRFTISLVWLLAIAAFAVLPSLAQAETKELVSGGSNSHVHRTHRQAGILPRGRTAGTL